MSTPGSSPVERPADHLLAVAAPGALPDVGAALEVLDRALAARGCTGDLVLTRDAAEVAAAVGAAATEVVLLPALADDVAGLGLPAAAAVVRANLADRAADRSPGVRRHVRGRGLDSIRYAVDAWYHHRVSPTSVHPYGDDPDQRAELRLPAGDPPPGGFPVAVLVHGGYWRSRWESDLMEPMALDLVARGLATWNVEYRRPDDHDWAATTSDVAAALAALEGVDADLDLSRVVTLGHSAGGQLVVRLAADVAGDPAAPVRPVLTVSLAGVLDLAGADRHGLGGGATAAALGGGAADLPEVYRASSPIDRLPVGSPVAVVCGRDDDPHLLDMARRFAAAGVAAGDDVVVVEDDGDHFAVIDPATPIWARVAEVVERTLVPRP